MSEKDGKFGVGCFVLTCWAHSVQSSLASGDSWCGWRPPADGLGRSCHLGLLCGHQKMSSSAPWTRHAGDRQGVGGACVQLLPEPQHSTIHPTHCVEHPGAGPARARPPPCSEKRGAITGRGPRLEERLRHLHPQRLAAHGQVMPDKSFHVPKPPEPLGTESGPPASSPLAPPAV